MKITVITPTFNSEKNIDKCVQSIISQSYQNFEHVIIDNISTDRTLEIIKNIYSKNNILSKLRIICEKDCGISNAFNKGIVAASGNIIGILNSDDIYYSNNVFQNIINAFTNSKILFVHGNIFFKDELYGSNIRKPLFCDIRVAMPYNHPTMFLRRELYDKVGVFNTDYKYAMDFDLICRLYKFYKKPEASSVYLTEEPLVVMSAGGASWANEINSIHETKKILIANNKWDLEAKKHYCLRLFRTKTKAILTVFGLNFVVKLWRRSKWLTNTEFIP
jgi:glycosyltransferase involved in cell wall biosynthesis